MTAPHPGAPGGLAAGVGVAAPLLAGEGEVTVSVGRVEVPPHLLRPAHTRPKHTSWVQLQTVFTITGKAPTSAFSRLKASAYYRFHI